MSTTSSTGLPPAGDRAIADDLGDTAGCVAADIVVIVHDDGADSLWCAHRGLCQGKGGNPAETTVDQKVEPIEK